MPEDPTLEQVLRTIAAEAPLDRVAASLGIPAVRVGELVIEAADALQWRIPTRAARAQAGDIVVTMGAGGEVAMLAPEVLEALRRGAPDTLDSGSAV